MTETKKERALKRKNEAREKKSKTKRRCLVLAPKDDEVVLPPVRNSDDPAPKSRWTNKQRVLIFAERGITHLHRHLMVDLRSMLPHAKPDSKKDKNEALSAVNDICEMKNCNKAIFFEARRKKDLYMWLSNVPKGPSVKFQVRLEISITSCLCP
jgi:ribosome biogenesis protein BRX1